MEYIRLCDCPPNGKKKGKKHIFGHFREVATDSHGCCLQCGHTAIVKPKVEKKDTTKSQEIQ